ncbi:MAG TPA: phosphatidylinositol-specific phospholipase C/glycerophosphodiester phosphodiesterase family protein [Sedimentisphaerales bacterium]|nr:phosphatidylinositol-specific phospholipase C/glycerophosphodiester phosphodiesterase family protein [Sedimentisphaerales bacterium]HRS12472.1 phosphatidylinositol-specific phospholipase C/glycerophosphodiester phosphodiesterase family protein [Sedimentisphaerales bacterium]HRV49085.1 phosphatidylinositol-specific phospholipase C/glycerophosphodiester phosphodiesterase family protein [Sedimentisphaerales bacterium]
MITDIFIVVMTVVLTEANVTPLARAHAHNDYLHQRPLFDALSHGFASVEADVFLVGDQLCVAHGAPAIRPDRTLRSLYLDPLRERARQNGGRIHPGHERFLLLIDLKSAAEPTYLRLHETLAEYRDLVTSFGPEGRQDRAILVIVSGNRPFELMRSQKTRYAGCDGRLADLDSDAPADLVPLISDRWFSHFTWRGEGPMPDVEAQKLKQIVDAAHEKGRLVRFWATPEVRSLARDAVWRQLLMAGVDLLNTDDLEGLQAFLLAHER